ncbi:EscU/YscU/HrcU family type III secretion system export apparatus switch protein, partial [Escherichia coli]
VLVALISPVMLGGLVFSGKSLQPKFSKLNPLPGIKRMFSAQTGAELLKAILKTILVGSVTGFFLWHHWPQMMRLMAESPITAMGNAMDLENFGCKDLPLNTSPPSMTGEMSAT